MESKGRQRGRGLVSLTVPPSRHWLGPLGPALVASAGCWGWGGCDFLLIDVVSGGEGGAEFLGLGTTPG